jgi:glycosyltransferase involved in cell wall biosynthesis
MRMRRAGVEAATRLVRLSRILPGRLGAPGRYFETLARLDAGQVDTPWRAEVRSALEVADVHLAAGRTDQALGWFDKALRIGYHPALHYTDASSPLTGDPEGFLAPYRASAIGRLLLEPPVHDTGPTRPRQRPAGAGPTRLLVVAQQNWTFVESVIEVLEGRGNFEIRRFEVNSLPASQRPSREHVLRARHDLSQGRRLPIPEPLAEHFAWADVVLVEWGHHVLTWLSMFEQLPRISVARFHRFEAYTPFPLLTDFAHVDRTLFVSPPVRNLVSRLVSQLEEECEVLEVDNVLARGLGEYPDNVRDPFLIAQVGWVRPVKDVLFTLDVLEALRDTDPRYHLELVGPGLPEDPAQDTHHDGRVRARLAALPAGAVTLLGPRQDVPEVLAGAGWIISSSLIEGVHEAVMEGLAAGCVPVIRDWPGTREYGGAGGIYRKDWVVADQGAAVARVLAVQSAGNLSALSLDARAWVEQRRSPDTIARLYEHALRPGNSPSPGVT